jgi:glycosyltransferase involved in cell wall biosynthesis
LRDAPKILFVPVSGIHGMGEYARSIAIAAAVKNHWPAADIHFILSRQAPYATSAPFPSTLLPSSPTFHSSAVIELIQARHPDVVVFDNAGRTAQIRAAANCAARVVYISSRPRQRRKAFRWQWMGLLDEHWIAYPEFIAGGLNALERFKLKCRGRPVVRYLDVILAKATAEQRDSIVARAGFAADSYVLVVPGGGTGHPGARDALERFSNAADSIADSGTPTILVGRSQSQQPKTLLRCFESLPQADLGVLMQGARLIVANGGSTLLQAIACGRACVAAPIAQDQSERIRRCVSAGVAIAASLDASNLARAAQDLLSNEDSRRALAKHAADLRLADGVDTALQALIRLVDLDSAAPVAHA